MVARSDGSCIFISRTTPRIDGGLGVIAVHLCTLLGLCLFLFGLFLFGLFLFGLFLFASLDFCFANSMFLTPGLEVS